MLNTGVATKPEPKYNRQASHGKVNSGMAQVRKATVKVYRREEPRQWQEGQGRQVLGRQVCCQAGWPGVCKGMGRTGQEGHMVLGKVGAGKARRNGGVCRGTVQWERSKTCGVKGETMNPTTHGTTREEKIGNGKWVEQRTAVGE